MDPLDGDRDGDEKVALAQAIDSMWHKFLPQILERAGTLEDAASAAAAGHLNEEQREAAQSAAHKLAGTLGTFGLARGTRLARELEQLYTGPAGAVSGAPVDRLVRLAAEVRAIIESRK